MNIKPQQALLTLFSLFSVKFLILSGSWQEVAFGAIIASLGACYYLISLKEKEDKVIQRLEAQEEELKSLKTHVSTLKLTQTFKPINNQNQRI